jgi:hypothetical protein
MATTSLLLYISLEDALKTSPSLTPGAVAALSKDLGSRVPNPCPTITSCVTFNMSPSLGSLAKSSGSTILGFFVYLLYRSISKPQGPPSRLSLQMFAGAGVCPQTLLPSCSKQIRNYIFQNTTDGKTKLK